MELTSSSTGDCPCLLRVLQFQNARTLSSDLLVDYVADRERKVVHAQVTDKNTKIFTISSGIVVLRATKRTIFCCQ